MDIGSGLLGLALLALIAFVVARPLMEKPVDEQPVSPAEQLLGERERVLTQLRDLDFDQAMGKINQEDYAALRAQLVAAGVAILKQLDALGVEREQPLTAADPAGVAGQVGVTSVPALADEIEAAVAQRRARRPLVQPGRDAEIEAGVAQRRAAGAPRPATARAAPAMAAAASPLPSPPSLDAEIEANVAQRRAAGRTRSTPVEAPAAGAPLPAAEKPPSAAARLTCAQCGAEVLADDRFCPKCGSVQIIACGHCGRVARAGDQFCAQCGQSLPAPDGQASLRT